MRQKEQAASYDIGNNYDRKAKENEDEDQQCKKTENRDKERYIRRTQTDRKF